MRLPASCVALLAAALSAASCSTARSTGQWAGGPVLQFVGLDGSETCEDQPHLVPPSASKETLRIGSWNMLYLGPSEKTPVEKRDPRDLAEYVRLGGAQVLALQEIGVQIAADGRASNPTLDAMFDDLRARGAGDWTYVVYGDAEKDRDQFVGLAWDRRAVRQVGEAMPLDLDCETPSGPIPFLPWPNFSGAPMRRPIAVKLATRQGTDLVFVAVHLPARIETFFLEDATAHREVEADAIAKEMDHLVAEFHDRDVVVLGDFNVELATEKVAEALLKKGWRDLNCMSLTTYKWGMALDHVFVPNDQPEFALRPDFAVVAPPGVKSWSEFEERWSDHLMVVADVLVGPDDD
jgi:endonuclease/exonuclease/phosphatase family metal-dependent hydrolase